MTATTIITQQQQHGNGGHKKCSSASCCSRSKIWKAIQTAIAMDDKKGLTLMFQDQERMPHIKTALIKERNQNDASALPPSHKHRILQFDKTLRPEANSKFGKSVTDLNGLQVALFHQREDIACQLLQFLRQQASPTELDSFLGHVWGKGNSSLHLACFHGMPRLVQLLLDMGADPNVMNACHFKPADCCKDPGCLALLEKATASSDASTVDESMKDDPGVSVSRRGSAGLLLTKPSSPPEVVSLKRQASSPGGLNARGGGSLEKRVKSGVLVSPTRSVQQQQQQPTKEAPKIPVVLSSVHDINNSVGTWQQYYQAGVNNDKVNRPPPVMRPSLALKPTPETERPALVPQEKEPAMLNEEDPPAALTQQHQHKQQKQQQLVSTEAPTETGDSVNNPHPPERLQQHSSLSAEANGQGSTSPPANISLLSTPTFISHQDDVGVTATIATISALDDDDRGPSITTTLGIKTSVSSGLVDDGEGGGGGTSFTSSLTRMNHSPWVPDKSSLHLQPSDSPPAASCHDRPSATHHEKNYLGAATDHDYYQEHQENSERVKHQGMISPTTITEQQQSTTCHPYQERVLTRTCSTALDPDDSSWITTRNTALVFATQHLISYGLMTMITNQRIFDQVKQQLQQYNNQEETITFGAMPTLSVDDDDDDDNQHYHLYQHHHGNMPTRTTTTTRQQGFSRYPMGAAAINSLLGSVNSQSFIEQQHHQVAVL